MASLAAVAAASLGHAGGSIDHRVVEACRRTYVHGVDERLARDLVGAEGLPTLVALLDDPSFPRRDNVVAFLAYLGGPTEAAALRDLVVSPVATLESPVEDRAMLLAVEALGRIAHRGDPGATHTLRMLEDLTAGAVAAGKYDGRYRADLINEGSRVPKPTRASRSGTTLPGAAVSDASLMTEALGVSSANHAALTAPIDGASRARLLASGSRVIETQEDPESADVACCVTLAGLGQPATFGVAGDGLDIIDNEAELAAVLGVTAGRVKVVRAIHYCDGGGTNIIGCGSTPGASIAVVNLGFDLTNGLVWAHELGHNAGLDHVIDPDRLMSPILDADGSREVIAQECAKLHDPDPRSAFSRWSLGFCEDDGDGVAPPADVCPSMPEVGGGFDFDQDGFGTSCDLCPLNADPDQRDTDHDGIGDACDGCPTAFDPRPLDRDQDGTPDACDPCPLERVNDADGDGHCAEVDDCPSIYDPQQPDADGDGVGDLCDLCPDDSMADFDRDGLCHAEDPCPEDYGRGPRWAVTFPLDQTPRTIPAGDLNGDGLADFVYARGQTGVIDVVLGFAGVGPQIVSQLHGEAEGLGRGIAGGGDFDGDGFDDLAIGDDHGHVDAYHGSASGLEPSPRVSLSSSDGAPTFGRVLRVADVDGDGYADLAVASHASPFESYPSGRIDVFHGSASGLSTTPSGRLYPADPTDVFAFQLEEVGDVDGDGYDDLAVSYATFAVPSGGEGEIGIYRGSPEGIGETPAWMLSAEVGTTGFGLRVGHGDFDGDGSSDVIVSSFMKPEASGYYARAIASVHRGGVSGPEAQPSWRHDRGADFASSTSRPVEGAGDVNGDGYDDALVSWLVPEYVGGRYDEPRVDLFLGGASGLRDFPAERIADDEDRRTYFGLEIGGLGDTNGDGFGEVVVLRPANGGFPTALPRLAVYLGAEEGLREWYPDEDGDSVPNACDACPFQSNPGNADRDHDGYGDVCDACPGDLWNDLDDDGLCGDVDNCPTTANVGQEDVDHDGMGDACDDCPDLASPDLDRDGACDARDDCPGLYNVQSDPDGDGIGDACDNCPQVGNPDQANLDGDFAGDACDLCPAAVNVPVDDDVDGDGARDGCDNCPQISNPDQADADGEGFGDVCDPDRDNDGWMDVVERLRGTDPSDPDTDDDGRIDASDNCPRVPNEDQSDGDADGVGTACDVCPEDFDPLQADFDRNGAGDACASGFDARDVDRSGRVDGADLARFGRAFASRSGEGRFDPLVDFDRSGVIDGADLALLAAAWGRAF